MFSIDKIKVGSSTYNISPSKDGTLTGFTSNDFNTSSEWTDTDIVTVSDNNSSIFSKITTMVKNVRWLYNKLGTTDFSATGQSTVTGALSALQSGLNGKAASSHSHTTAQLPVYRSQINSNSYIPTSALVYSVQQQINSLNDAIANLEFQLDPPNERYEFKDLGTWSSVSDVNTFFSRFNHSTNYKDGDTKLSLGNYVTIQDGTYNAVWEIAGFDMESNQNAADGTTFDNGYGICMIPYTQVTTTGRWNTSNTTVGGYKSSYMHTTVLPDIVTKLKTILGSHIVNRNVLLSSSTDGNYSNAYTWTTAYATLMSVGQMNGTFAANRNKYDDGEANYKLPIFNSKDFKTGSDFWSRGVYGSDRAWIVRARSNDSFHYSNTSSSLGVRPLIYLR